MSASRQEVVQTAVDLESALSGGLAQRYLCQFWFADFESRRLEEEDALLKPEEFVGELLAPLCDPCKVEYRDEEELQIFPDLKPVPKRILEQAPDVVPAVLRYASVSSNTRVATEVFNKMFISSAMVRTMIRVAMVRRVAPKLRESLESLGEAVRQSVCSDSTQRAFDMEFRVPTQLVNQLAVSLSRRDKDGLKRVSSDIYACISLWNDLAFSRPPAAVSRVLLFGVFSSDTVLHLRRAGALPPNCRDTDAYRQYLVQMNKVATLRDVPKRKRSRGVKSLVENEQRILGRDNVLQATAAMMRYLLCFPIEAPAAPEPTFLSIGRILMRRELTYFSEIVLGGEEHTLRGAVPSRPVDELAVVMAPHCDVYAMARDAGRGRSPRGVFEKAVARALTVFVRIALLHRSGHTGSRYPLECLVDDFVACVQQRPAGSAVMRSLLRGTVKAVAETQGATALRKHQEMRCVAGHVKEIVNTAALFLARERSRSVNRTWRLLWPAQVDPVTQRLLSPLFGTADVLFTLSTMQVTLRHLVVGEVEKDMRVFGAQDVSKVPNREKLALGLSMFCAQTGSKINVAPLCCSLTMGFFTSDLVTASVQSLLLLLDGNKQARSNFRSVNNPFPLLPLARQYYRLLPVLLGAFGRNFEVGKRKIGEALQTIRVIREHNEEHPRASTVMHSARKILDPVLYRVVDRANLVGGDSGTLYTGIFAFLAGILPDVELFVPIEFLRNLVCSLPNDCDEHLYLQTMLQSVQETDSGPNWFLLDYGEYGRPALYEDLFTEYQCEAAPFYTCLARCLGVPARSRKRVAAAVASVVRNTSTGHALAPSFSHQYLSSYGVSTQGLHKRTPTPEDIEVRLRYVEQAARRMPGRYDLSCPLVDRDCTEHEVRMFGDTMAQLMNVLTTYRNDSMHAILKALRVDVGTAILNQQEFPLAFSETMQPLYADSVLPLKRHPLLVHLGVAPNVTLTEGNPFAATSRTLVDSLSVLRHVVGS